MCVFESECVYEREREKERERKAKSGAEFTRNQTHPVHWRGIEFEIKNTYIKISPKVVKMQKKLVISKHW